MRLQYPVSLMCRLFKVSAGGYYVWCSRPLSKRVLENQRLEVEIAAAHKRTRETCGPERLQKDLAAYGVTIGLYRIRRIRQKLGIRCKQKRRFKATTNSRHNLPVADNLLGRNFTATGPNQVWVTDTTYIPTGEGWLYLAGHKDIFTKEIVGYAVDGGMSKGLVSKSLFNAVKTKRPAAGLIHHSDRGSQYCSGEYRKLLEHFGMKSSMSGKGNCYDNAPMESFWGTLKSELVHNRRYSTRQEAIQEITEYIEMFYNRQRRQAGLGFLSPAVYEQQFYTKQLAV
jgi:transposase InsO family protein